MKNSAKITSNQTRHTTRPIVPRKELTDSTRIILVNPGVPRVVYAPEPDPWVRVTGIASLITSVVAFVFTMFVWWRTERRSRGERRAELFRRLVTDFASEKFESLYTHCEEVIPRTFDNVSRLTSLHDDLSARLVAENTSNDLQSAIYKVQNAITARLERQNIPFLLDHCDSLALKLEDILITWYVDACMNRNPQDVHLHRELAEAVSGMQHIVADFLSDLAEVELSLYDRPAVPRISRPLGRIQGIIQSVCSKLRRMRNSSPLSTP